MTVSTSERFFFSPCSAYSISVPHQGWWGTLPTAVEAQSPAHWTAVNSLQENSQATSLPVKYFPKLTMVVFCISH